MAYSKEAYLRWPRQTFMVVGHMPVKIFQLINCFFDATLTRNRIYFKGKFLLTNGCFFPRSIKH